MACSQWHYFGYNVSTQVNKIYNIVLVVLDILFKYIFLQIGPLNTHIIVVVIFIIIKKIINRLKKKAE